MYAGPVLEDKDWMKNYKGFYASYINEYYPTKAEFIIDLKDYIKVSVIAAKEEPTEQELVKIPGTDTPKVKEK